MEQRQSNLILRIKDFFKYRRIFTIRVVFSLSALAILTAFTVNGSTELKYIRLEPSEELIAEDSEFVVDIYAYTPTPVNEVEFSIDLDEEHLEVVGINFDDSVSVNTSQSVDKKGNINLQIKSFEKGFIGEHRIATLDLRAKANGDSFVKVKEVDFIIHNGEDSNVVRLKDNVKYLHIYNAETSP